ncbi:hypothetical protein QP445_16500, partial [Micrococcus luteus]|nr:hypothetical protein [Micrococcus luteus]
EKIREMNFLEELLDGAEVEWLPLQKLTKTITAPTKVKRNEYLEIGVYPVIDQGIEFISGYVSVDYEALEEGEYIIFGDHS